MDEEDVKEDVKEEELSDEEDDEEMEEEEALDQEMSRFKDKLMGIIEGAGYGEKRSSKLGLDDYLKLLYAFNESGVHFR